MIALKYCHENWQKLKFKQTEMVLTLSLDIDSNNEERALRYTQSENPEML